MEAVWKIQQGLPVDHIDPLIARWARKASYEFHLVKIDDRRDRERLPGQVDVADLAHNGGWFLDYSTAQILAPDGSSYVLMAKMGLAAKLPPGMSQGVDIIGRNLPGVKSQGVMEAAILGPLIYGFSDAFSRVGATDVAFYGAMTMGVPEEADPSVLVNPEALLSDRFVTAADLRGIGRGASVVEGAVALRGTFAAVRPVVSATLGGHGAGPKPDEPFKAQPREAHTTVVETDPIARPRGLALLPDRAPLSSFTERNAGEMDTWWRRRQLTQEASARRIQEGSGGGPSLEPEGEGDRCAGDVRERFGIADTVPYDNIGILGFT